MRTASETPGSSSKSLWSNCAGRPTPARMVCTAPVVRWTLKPMATMRSTTVCICSSVAFSCIATIIGSLFSFLLLIFAVRSGRGQLVLLERAHHVDDALVNVLQLNVGERSVVGRADIVKDDALAVRLVNGEVGGAFELADFVRRRGPLVEQRDDLPVDFI